MIDFKEIIVGETYNVGTKEIYKTLGRELRSMILTDIRLLQGASQIEDVVTLFTAFSNANGIDLMKSQFYVFKDVNNISHCILKEYMETVEVSQLFPIKIDMFSMDRVKLEQLKRLLKSGGFTYTIVT
jgi:hypothetical protein